MIDTVKLTLPAYDELIDFVNLRSDKLQRLCGNGEIVWERSWLQSSLPSHFAGLRIAYSPKAEKVANGIKNAKDIIEFEFSLAKWVSPYGYNHKNVLLLDDIESLKKWVREFNSYLGFQFPYNLWTVTRVDFAEVYNLIGGSTEQFLRQVDVKMSRYTGAENKTHKYDGSIYYPSSWIAKKIYDKYAEWKRHEGFKYKKLKAWGYLDGDAAKEGETMKLLAKNSHHQIKNAKKEFLEKYGKEPMLSEEIEALKNTLRLEVEFRRDFLAANGIVAIDDIIKLEERFHDESIKWLSIRNLKECLDNLSVNEYFLIDRCKRVGFKQARLEFVEKFTERTFYRTKVALKAKNIFVDFLENQDFRKEITEVDGKVSKFELRLAA